MTQLLNIQALNDFLESEFTSTILSRGKSLVSNIDKLKIEHTNDITEITAKIKGSSSKKYDVEIDIQDGEVYAYNCDCPYAVSGYDTCKHIAALALHLVANNTATPAKEVAAPENPSSKIAKIIKLKTNEPLPLISMEIELTKMIDKWSINYHCVDNEAAAISLQTNIYQLTKSRDGKRFDLTDKKIINSFLEKNEGKDKYRVGCNCKSFKAIKPCSHIGAIIARICEKYGPYYFKQFEDNTAAKNRLLANYGFNVDSEIVKDFEFGYTYWGELQIKNKPEGLLEKFGPNTNTWDTILSKLPTTKPKQKTAQEKITEVEQNERNAAQIKPEDPYDVGILFNLNENAINGFRIDGLKITDKGSNDTIKIIKLKANADINFFANVHSNIRLALTSLTEQSLIQNLKEHTATTYYNENSPFKRLNSKEENVINEAYKDALLEMANDLKNFKQLYYLPNGSSLARKNIVPCSFSTTELDCKLLLEQNTDTISLELMVVFKETNEEFKEYSLHKFLLKANDVFYIIPMQLQKLKNILPHKKIIAPISEKSRFINDIVLPLSLKYNVDFNNILTTETIDNTASQPRLYLSELNEKFLMITPKWLYSEYEVENDKQKLTQVEAENAIVNIERNSEEEEAFIERVKLLHPKFATQNNEYFYLHFDEVMRNNWFLEMYSKLQELNVPIFGMNNLKRFNYNANKPTIQFKTGSGTDWFDLRIEVSYGDQIVPLAALRKAIINKQQFILLNDGTLGMLPEEWIKKFATMMRLGTIKDDSLQLSKLHFTVIDQLHEQITDHQILEELQAKKDTLKEIENIKNVKLPANIKAELRDYQKVGFQWMTTLEQMNWGGCLADDMGLGKTLQTLSFISYLQKQNKKETHLIVCPTSLIYNWESEIQKFTPHLKYNIHYAAQRDLTPQILKESNIIITSYGTLRNDIELLMEHQFGYLILDESQAIKNHLSQTTKAVQLIKCRNRLILSGTPVQNNTFDLYSQFNFINPGLLGNMEFFKTEFANAIDRDNDKAKTEELRKIIHPFILRRTKEQVAKDLPEKTETILWCEMDKEQRKIYNSFKDYYRKEILKKIETEGFAKAGIFILSGLTKLRQICDSPAILNAEEQYPNVSVKIEELMREIEENTSNHKALVFSQFTTMLDLISKELDKRKIKYYYLDGSTNATDRKKAVANFQDDDKVKIFLISLKAGGVGLNLTSADYVYLVDPWWNPAVEQQAIDRTHRIGQTQKVFAYKLICKDSIEEKILQLQQKKKALSADLISDENGFVKKLTKEDVAYLFS